MAKKRVFVSFDFDNDKVLKDFIIGQSRLADSPFEVIDTSLKEAAPMKTWEDKARALWGRPSEYKLLFRYRVDIDEEYHRKHK